ncbi:WAS/WASL-interacting protein family member 1-like [Palaemon carinicauda]|uniref:WAS/WASL-interacting protein family member 1-like n=1 Tax=Palaemon carinicauda TaxID=392227 RepID=UPI0035B6AA92
MCEVGLFYSSCVHALEFPAALVGTLYRPWTRILTPYALSAGANGVIDPDALNAPPDTAPVQSPGPSGLQGLERKTAPLAPKRQAPPARPPAVVPADPDITPRRSPLGVRASVPATRQGPPARPRPSMPRHPPAVPELARKRPTAHTRPVPDTAPTHPPAPTRPPAPPPPVPVSSRAVQEVPELAHRRPQVPADSSRPSGKMRDTRPRAVPVPALTCTPTRPRVATAQRVVQEAPKLVHGRSRPPLGSPSRPHELATDTIAHDAPVSRPVPVFKTTKVAQRTPEHPHAARPARPPQPRTPVRPHPDVRHARPRSPTRPARPQASVPVLPD